MRLFFLALFSFQAFKSSQLAIMKLFAAAFLLPLVLGCLEPEPNICGEYELSCNNGVDVDGCWMGN